MDKTTSVKHYFDQWHVAKGLVKKLLVASKLKGCEVISDWIKAEKKSHHLVLNLNKSWLSRNDSG